MAFSLVITAIYSAALVLFYEFAVKNKGFKPGKWVYFALLFFALAVRLFFAAQNTFFTTDINCFNAWSSYTVAYGFKRLYSQGIFLDYPPGYMYVLWVLKNISLIFKTDPNSTAYIFMLKLPAIMGDFACAALIYKGAEKAQNKQMAFFAASAFVFCPAVIYNSAVWGQVDSIFVFFIAFALWLAFQNKTVPAALAAAAAIFIKPQALIAGPVLLFYILEQKSVKEFLKAAVTGLVSLYILALPFCPSPFNFSWLITLYKTTMGGYKYFTVNAYNIYSLMGLNWKSLSGTAGAEEINILVITLLVLFSAFAFFKLKDRTESFFTIASFIFLTVFCFSTMMHERYVFPAVVFLALAFGMNKNRLLLYIYLAVSGGLYLNSVSVLKMYENGYYPTTLFKNFVAAIFLFGFIALFAYILNRLKQNRALDFSAKQKEITGVLVFTAIYASAALFALGSTKAPQTYFLAGENNMSFDLEFETTQEIAKIYTYNMVGDYNAVPKGAKAKGDFHIYLSQDGVNFEKAAEINSGGVFAWKETQITAHAVAARVEAQNSGDILGEIAFFDNAGNLIKTTLANYNRSAQYSPQNATDEGDTVPQDTSYYHSSYFDEIYHARTAYEQLNGYEIYETTHPPLGKIIISIGIWLFGMTPFGWRIAGVFCGILMLPLAYIIVKHLTNSRFGAFCCMFLLSVDFMHYTQTAIATVDTYVVLFTMLTFLFMILYHKQPLGEIKKQFAYLLLSGIFMGCAVSVKWNGAYPMAGLAIFFFISLRIKYKESKKDSAAWQNAVKTIMFCFAAFVFVPLTIYTLSYLPVLKGRGFTGFLQGVVNYQKHMWNYHSTLDSTHFFSSLWYTWPFNIKPMWYSVANLSNGLVSTISAFGNIFIFPLTLIAPFICIYISRKTKNTSLLILPLGYLFAYIPWVLVTRLSFIYHYFPAAVLGIIALGVIGAYLEKLSHKTKKYIAVYLLLCFIAFVLYFPVIKGMGASKEYIDFLELLPSWYFVN